MHFREKMTQFDHERIPQRIVHARGVGAVFYTVVGDRLYDLPNPLRVTACCLRDDGPYSLRCRIIS
nr:catalase [Paenibacillus glycanilyticus]